MTDAISFDVFAFDPVGGFGVRLACTTSSASAVVPTPDPSSDRVVISNSGNVPAYVALGQSDVVATVNCYEILPGTKEVIKVPFTTPGRLYVAGITETGSTKVSVCRGRGF